MKNSRRTSTRNSTRPNRARPSQERQSQGGTRSHGRLTGSYEKSVPWNPSDEGRMLSSQYSQRDRDTYQDDDEDNDYRYDQGGQNIRSQKAYGEENDESERNYRGRDRSMQSQSYDDEDSNAPFQRLQNRYEDDDERSRHGGYIQRGSSSGRGVGGYYSAEIQDRNEYGQFAGYNDRRSSFRPSYDENDDENKSRRGYSNYRRGYSKR